MRNVAQNTKVRLTFVAMVAVMTASLLFVGWQADQTRGTARQARETARQGKLAHDALCALNQRNKDRIATSEQFLHDHPNGIPGVPVKIIRDGIRADQSTVNILVRTLGECPTPPPRPR